MSDVERIRAVVAYDGTDYFGFQRQRKEHLTIQGELEKALYAICHEQIPVMGSGRTDSGVHATGQVIAFDVAWRHDLASLERALNAKLPASIVIRNLDVVSSDFHPRFSAKSRRYEYKVLVVTHNDPIQRLYKWQMRKLPSLTNMNKAATLLIGSQDFATFGQPPQGLNTVREIFQAEWRQDKANLTFHIEANAFLYRMVLSIVGSLIFVGEGKWSVADFEDALRSKDRGRSGKTAPPHGLYLTKVIY
jgi:tRNA pseudouridine38-40 synthase